MNIGDYVAYIDQMGCSIGKIAEVKPKTLKVKYFCIWTTDTAEKIENKITRESKNKWFRTVNKNDVKFITASIDEIIQYTLNQNQLDNFLMEIERK